MTSGQSASDETLPLNSAGWRSRSRIAASILVSSVSGAALTSLLAGWIYPCLGAARWENCAWGTEADPSTFTLPICQLGACDATLSWTEVLSRLLVVAALASATGAVACYLSKAHRALSAGAAVVLAGVFVVVALPYAYPHH